MSGKNKVAMGYEREGVLMPLPQLNEKLANIKQQPNAKVEIGKKSFIIQGDLTKILNKLNETPNKKLVAKTLNPNSSQIEWGKGLDSNNASVKIAVYKPDFDTEKGTVSKIKGLFAAVIAVPVISPIGTVSNALNLNSITNLTGATILTGGVSNLANTHGSINGLVDPLVSIMDMSKKGNNIIQEIGEHEQSSNSKKNTIKKQIATKKSKLKNVAERKIDAMPNIPLVTNAAKGIIGNVLGHEIKMEINPYINVNTPNALTIDTGKQELKFSELADVLINNLLTESYKKGNKKEQKSNEISSEKRKISTNQVKLVTQKKSKAKKINYKI